MPKEKTMLTACWLKFECGLLWSCQPLSYRSLIICCLSPCPHSNDHKQPLNRETVKANVNGWPPQLRMQRTLVTTPGSPKVSLAAVHGVAMQCFTYEIRIREKQGFASSIIERLLSLPCEFWMKKQTSLESNQIESYF